MEAQHAARRVYSSHPDYQELNNLQTMLCHAYNPHLASQPPERMDVDESVVESLIQTLKTALGELMDEGNFKEFEAAWAYARDR